PPPGGPHRPAAPAHRQARDRRRAALPLLPAAGRRPRVLHPQGDRVGVADVRGGGTRRRRALRRGDARAVAAVGPGGDAGRGPGPGGLTGAPTTAGGYGVTVITSIHMLVYSDDAPATRAFLRDVLGFPYVEDTGTEEGWLIFGTGP